MKVSHEFNSAAKEARLRLVGASYKEDRDETWDDFTNPAKWHGKPIPQREWYIEDLIPSRQVTLLSGDGGVGKSLLALQIAAAGAMGVDTLGVSPRRGRTLYIGAEDEEDEFHRRLVDIAEAHGCDLDSLGKLRLRSLANCDALLVVPDKQGNMRQTKLLDRIYDYASHFEPSLIILDTAADLFGGDEIKRGQVRQFIGYLRQMAIAIDCAVVLLSHPSVSGMQSGSGSSGSTAWNNSVRSRLYLTRPDERDADPDSRVLKVMKANYGKTGSEIKLRWKGGAFIIDDGKPSKQSALLLASAESIFLDLLSRLNQQGQKVSHKTGLNYAPKLMAKHSLSGGLSKRDLESAQQRLLDAGRISIEEEGPPSKRTSRLVLA